MAPGQCISTDQLKSLTPAFIAPLKGGLTKLCYNATIVFVDHFSRLLYAHLQTNLLMQEMLEAKKAFEVFC